MWMIFILDASPIIAFYSETELNEPDLLHSLNTLKDWQIVIPSAVFDEITKGRKSTSSILRDATESNKVNINNEIVPEETQAFGKRYPRLHDGELQVLLLGLRLKAKGIHSFFCIIDEEPARTIAQKNGLPLKGTKGLITYFRENNLINTEKMENLLYRLSHSNFRL